MRPVCRCEWNAVAVVDANPHEQVYVSEVIAVLEVRETDEADELLVVDCGFQNVC